MNYLLGIINEELRHRKAPHHYSGEGLLLFGGEVYTQGVSLLPVVL